MLALHQGSEVCCDKVHERPLGNKNNNRAVKGFPL